MYTQTPTISHDLHCNNHSSSLHHLSPNYFKSLLNGHPHSTLAPFRALSTQQLIACQMKALWCHSSSPNPLGCPITARASRRPSKGLWDCSPSGFSSYYQPAPVLLNSLLFLKHVKHIPASRPLHLLFPPPGMPSPQIIARLALSCHSDPCSNATISEVISLIALFK